MLERRAFLVQSSAAAIAALAPSASAGARSTPTNTNTLLPNTTWHNVTTWGVEGKGWADTEHDFDRLPARAKGVVPDPVWNLSQHSAGMSVFFETHAREIRVRYTLRSDRLAMPHMAATGVSGLDLYGLDTKTNTWRWGAVFKPTAATNERAIITDLDGTLRQWRIYLPLYNGVKSLEIGVPDDATFTPIAPRTEKPIVFYGTSILHGACASRPGMAWPSIVGRRLDAPTINLGFSGNGRMETALAELLTDLDAAAYVIDCAPNMNAAQIRERAAPLVRIVRKARPEAPIVLVEDRNYGYGWLKASARARNTENQTALQEAYAELQQSGMPKLAYITSEQLLGEDFGETMTDGSHPSDLGMTRYAEAVTPVLRALLG